MFPSLLASRLYLLDRNKYQSLFQKKSPDYPSLEELISSTKEKIFLEPIDQYFEEESNNIENNQDEEVDFTKLDDEFSKCLLLDNNEDISTSVESDELTNSTNKTLAKGKIFKFTDILILNKENINKTRNEIMNKYYWTIQNKNQASQC